MRKHWTSIRTFYKKGKVQSIFNFCYNQNLTVLIRKIIHQILQLQFHRFKINYSFGYILKNIHDNELRYYHASFNNSVMMETARLISKRQELIEFLNTLSEESFFEKINRPDSKWKVVDIPNITFYINHLKDAPLGAPISLPDYIKNNHGLRNVSAEDHLCFFRCLAVHQGANPHKCEQPAKNLFRAYCIHFGVAPADFAGVQLFDFVHLEDFFELNLIAYELDGKVAKLVQRSRELYKETMRLNVYENHLSVIVDFEHYCGVYQCVHCDKLWYRNCDYYRHTKICTTTVREVFPGGIHKNPATIFEKLEEIGIVVPHCDRYFPFFACYDFEAYFSKKQISNSSMLTLDACHIPLSVAVASNIPGYESGVCFVTEGSEEELVQKLVDYLETLSEVSYKFLLEKFNYVFEQLERSENVRKEKILNDFNCYCKELVVLGFNSASYDLNLIKPTLIEILLKDIQFVIKRTNSYLCLKTSKLRFLDIKNFLAPGFSYRKFLVAYGAELRKFYFPYEFVTDLDKLNSGLPVHNVFYSSLSKSNITQEEYNLVVKTWTEKGWSSLREMLIYYNILDCVPFVQAVQNLLRPYLEQGLDIFKTSFSVSGVAKLQMMKKIEKNAFFCLFPKRHGDLYKTLRSQLTGGLSLIFCRLAISGETKIRSHEIDNPETVKKVLGLDANSLYLYAIAQNNPTGYFCRYKEEEDFRPDPCSKFGFQSYQWLSYVAYKENTFLQTRFNMGERRVSKYSLPVDGYSEQQNTVYQFLGCFFHSCDRCNTNRNSDGSLEETHPLKNIPHEDIRKETADNRKKLEEEGFRVVEMRECEWLKIRKQPQVSRFLKTLKSITPKRKLTFEKIIEGIRNESLYGFLIVDIHTPNELKEKFKDFPLIIKNSFISRKDIGDYMQNVAEEHNLLKKEQKYLISSYFAEKFLINSEMAKFYLEMGLKITKIYEFIEFFPQKCFAPLAQEIVNSRRLADTDKSKAVIALTNKLTGNSLYSASLLNKEKHRNITYHSEETVNKTINDPRFVHLDEIKKNVYEVKSLKNKIVNDLPIQIGLNVYLNSKLHMLKFFYLFLKKYIPDRHFELLETDTDSIYFSISRENLDDCVPSHLKPNYFRDKLKWLTSEVCPNHEEAFIQCKIENKAWDAQPCCSSFEAFDKRTLGKMKVEYEGKNQVCLASKSYFCQGETNKQVCKGVSITQNPLTFDEYLNVLETNKPLLVENRGFRSKNHQIFSYVQKKKGLSNFYPKRKVLSDGVHTEPLDL